MSETEVPGGAEAPQPVPDVTAPAAPTEVERLPEPEAAPPERAPNPEGSSGTAADSPERAEAGSGSGGAADGGSGGASGGASGDGSDTGPRLNPDGTPRKPRRRGSRGGRKRSKARSGSSGPAAGGPADGAAPADARPGDGPGGDGSADDDATAETGTDRAPQRPRRAQPVTRAQAAADSDAAAQVEEALAGAPSETVPSDGTEAPASEARAKATAAGEAPAAASGDAPTTSAPAEAGTPSGSADAQADAPTPASKAATAKAATAKAATAKGGTAMGGTAKAATGEAATGEAATGEAATGEAATGEAATGEAATGEGGTAKAATGEAATGEAATGEAATGEAATGEGGTAKAATGEGGTGEAATGEGGTGEGGTGEGGTGEGGTGEGATGEGGTGEARAGSRRHRNRGRGGQGGQAADADADGAEGKAKTGAAGTGARTGGKDAKNGKDGKAGAGRASGGGRTRQPAPGDTEANAGADTAEDDRMPELPGGAREGRPKSVKAAAKALVPKIPPPRKPKIGDTIPAEALGDAKGDEARRGDKQDKQGESAKRKRRRRRGGKGGNGNGNDKPVEAMLPSGVELDEAALERRKGRERKGRPVGRYSMSVHVSEQATQIAVLEGRALIEHYVSRPSDDVSQIHGNIYLGRVQNVLPGMEAAFVDIGTPKNAVLYRGDVHYDQEDVERKGQQPRIEQMLRAGQSIVCQVTKNPIGAKGARLTQEVSLPGRFVVLIPNSSTYGISKRLADDERKRLRQILDAVKPAQHGIIVRTAAQNVTSEEIEDDVRRLARQWEKIEALAKRSKAPTLLYREPDMAVRVIREEFNQDYRNVQIDDPILFEAVRDYVASISPELADRVEYYDNDQEPLPLFERYHVHEQLHRALDRKVWLPSGGSLIIEHTEALTVIDVNTGKNVGRSSLEETVFKNNLEAAVEIARQLRLRDIGGIIVIDFIDMERKDNRDEVVRVFRDALSRDKTRTQVFDISELGLCEMTRKRIGEGLLESFSLPCPECEARGFLIDKELLPD